MANPSTVDPLAAILENLQKFGKSVLQSQALSLIGQMRGCTIMKPITVKDHAPIKDKEELNNITLTGDQPFFKEWNNIVNRPWLIVHSAFHTAWGSLRWPCRGLPCYVRSLSDFNVLAAIPMQTLLAKGLTLESCSNWFSDESDLSGDDFDIFVLAAGETIWVPMGVVCMFSSIPSSGQLEKTEKAQKGQLLVQWSLLEGEKAAGIENGVEVELKHDIGKVLRAHEASAPWKDIATPLSAWLDALP